MSEIQSLREIFSNELVTPNLDLVIDYSELAIDAVLEDGILKDIPIINTLISLCKISTTIRNIHFSKKILCFLSQFHRNGEQNVQSLKSNKLIKKIQNDDKFRRKVIDHLLIMIDRYLSEQKAVRLASLFRQFVEEKFDWDTFVYFSVCLDSMHDIDFDVLEFLISKSGTVVEEISIPYSDKYLLLSSVARLKSFGFIITDEPTWENVEDDFKKKIFLSSIGEIFAIGSIF